MSEFFEQTIQPHFNFWIYVILMMLGLWAVIAKKNMIKKLIGLSIFQTAIILFYVSIGVKEDATIPILDHHGPEHHEVVHENGEHIGDAETSAHPEEVHEKKGDHSHGDDHGHDDHATDPDTMANPLPHVLMLTAIVVGVATLGVALAICQMLFKEFGTLEEDEILAELKDSASDD